MTLRAKVVVRQFAGANNCILAGDYSALATKQTENDLKLKSEAVERSLHRMAKVHHFVDMWQGSQYQHATQNKSRAQIKQMTAMRYISDTEGIIGASW